MTDVGEPGPLPRVLQGQLSAADLADLSWLPPEVTGYEGEGFFYVEPAPPSPPRRDLPKSLVHSRLRDVGKLGAAWTVLSSNPDYLGRWLMPGYPTVYADDTDLLAVLAAAGCTATEIANITA